MLVSEDHGLSSNKIAQITSDRIVLRRIREVSLNFGNAQQVATACGTHVPRHSAPPESTLECLMHCPTLGLVLVVVRSFFLLFVLLALALALALQLLLSPGGLQRTEHCAHAARAGTPQHGLSSSKTGRVTSSCCKMRSLSTKWP